MKELISSFSDCSKVLNAMGDENRQHLILEMMQIGHCGGVRVGEIKEKTICPERRYPTICRF